MFQAVHNHSFTPAKGGVLKHVERFRYRARGEPWSHWTEQVKILDGDFQAAGETVFERTLHRRRWQFEWEIRGTLSGALGLLSDFTLSLQ